MTLRDLFLRIRAMVAPHRVERELDEELAFHIERDTQKHIAAGLSPIDARTRAMARFGSVSLAADQCRDERGTGLIDDLARDILYAFRTFRRAPLAALTIVATIAVGLGLVAAVFTFYSMFSFRVDAVQNPDELFEVVRPTSPGADSKVPLTRADYDALRRESEVFVDAAATVSGIETRIDGRVASPMLVTGTTEYGATRFVSMIERDKILGVQFHPEKSQHEGLGLLGHRLVAELVGQRIAFDVLQIRDDDVTAAFDQHARRGCAEARRAAGDDERAFANVHACLRLARASRAFYVAA